MNDSIVCADIGGTTTKAAIVDSSGHLHHLNTIPSQPDVESFFAALCDLLKQTFAAVDASDHHVGGIGVAVAGFLSPQRDRLVYNSNLKWLEEFPLLDRLSQRFEQKIELETDSNSACMAEFLFGTGRGSNRFLCATAGTGLGSA